MVGRTSFAGLPWAYGVPERSPAPRRDARRRRWNIGAPSSGFLPSDVGWVWGLGCRLRPPRANSDDGECPPWVSRVLARVAGSAPALRAALVLRSRSAATRASAATTR